MPLHASADGRIMNKPNDAHKVAARPTSASGRDRSQQQESIPQIQTTHSARVRSDERIVAPQEAESLKQPVSNFWNSRPSSANPFANDMKRQASQNTEDDEKENYDEYANNIKAEYEGEQRGRGSQQEIRTDQYTYAEDDEPTFGESDWDTIYHEPPEQQTVVFAPRHSNVGGLAGHRSRHTVQAGRYQAQQSDTAHDERSRYAPMMQHTNNDIDEDRISEVGDDDGAIQDLAEQTPSRTGTYQVVARSNKQQGSKAVRFQGAPPMPVFPQGSSSPIVAPEEGNDLQIRESPQLDEQQRTSLARHKVFREESRHYEPAEPLESARPAHASTGRPIAQPSTLHEGPEDLDEGQYRDETAINAKKRTYDEIDYDTTDLTAKTYILLDDVPFLTDPRAPLPNLQVDASGNPLPDLSARLTNLSKLRPEDQSNLFLSLTDDENEKAGQFFIESFSDSLRKLMEKRLERRKIALKYEMEARKRQKEVESKMADCEAELGELKTGGSKLVANRSVERIGGTPRKGRALAPAV